MVMVEGMEGKGDLGQEGSHQESLFYADDDMVALPNPRWLQGTSNTLVSLFDKVVMCNNVRNTVGMVCRSYQAARRMGDG